MKFNIHATAINPADLLHHMKYPVLNGWSMPIRYSPSEFAAPHSTMQNLCPAASDIVRRDKTTGGRHIPPWSMLPAAIRICCGMATFPGPKKAKKHCATICHIALDLASRIY
ncbi:MAG: hypothetical protein HY789_13050 [Deltaproteobacteria bacterium]|nr:hypothetical protein [Deltaproteobacteria bacterium]